LAGIMNTPAAVAGRSSSLRFIWPYQPLVPVAIALAGGVALDRYFPVSVLLWLMFTGGMLLCWGSSLCFKRFGSRVHRLQKNGLLPSAILLCAIGALAGTWHHVYWNVYSVNDVGHWCDRQGRPARVRGLLTEEPLVVHAGHRDPLRAMPERTRTLCQMHVQHIESGARWMDASGRAQLAIDGELTAMHAGQSVEVLGKIIAPPHAMNPGEFDYANYLRGRRIRALIHCDEPQAVTLLDEVRPSWRRQWLERTAGACERRLMQRLPAGQGEIAVALLLGRYDLLEEEVTDRYMRTGTMHILAISGQHLAVLATFLWFALRFIPIPRKWGAVLLGVTVVSYALLTGTRPPVLRAAVLVCVLVGAIVLDARSRRANPLALALIIVLALNPSDLFDRGLQLSFLAVGALSWIVDPAWKWLQPEPDPLEPLIAEIRPWWLRAARSFARVVVFAFVMSGVVWLANVPLLASRFHLFSPIVVPLTVVLTPAATIALIAGLGLLVVDPWLPQLGTVFAKICGWGIATMDWSVDVGARLPCGYWYVSGPPSWWLAGFYGGMLGVLLFRPQGIARLRWAAFAVGWLSLDFAVPALHPALDHLQCQILSVGNGSAAVLRLPTGRCVLVDAGQIAGPQVGARLIAPALWAAGITRIDAVFISHADVDHYNGLPQLAERFAIGAVYVPPHFARLEQEPLHLVCDSLRRRHVPIRVCFAEDRFDFGEDVTARVLHPPAEFGGSDNEQSLVLLVEFRGQRILLTGDPEGAGLNRLLLTDPMKIDVLVAPHHGSRRANPAQLADWCRPELVVVSQGRPRSGATLDSYRAADIPVMTTNDYGAITLDFTGRQCEVSYVQLPGTGFWPERKVRTLSSVPSLLESM
jgi:competence protein ComEC